MRSIRLTDEQRNIVTDNIGLAKKCAYAFWNKHLGMLDNVDIDDVLSMSYIGLCCGAYEYTPNHNYAQSTYLYTCCEHDLQNFLDASFCLKRSGYLNTASLNQKVYDKTYDQNVEIMDLIPNEIDAESEFYKSESAKDNSKLLKQLFEVLSDKEMEIITRLYYSSSSLKEASSSMKMSKWKATLIHKTALNKMRYKAKYCRISV